MATKQQIFVNNTLPTDKLLAGNGTDTLSEVTLGSGLSLSSGTLTATGGGSGSLIPLTTTFADCENTTSEIDIVTVTIPANILAVGDIINIEASFTRLQNNPSFPGFTQKLYNGGSIMYNIAGGATSNTIVYKMMQSLQFQVSSVSSGIATLFVHNNNSITTSVSKTTVIATQPTAVTSGATTTAISNNTMIVANTNTLKISGQWEAASSNSYIRMQQAQAYIIKKAV